MDYSLSDKNKSLFDIFFLFDKKKRRVFMFVLPRRPFFLLAQQRLHNKQNDV